MISPRTSGLARRGLLCIVLSLAGPAVAAGVERWSATPAALMRGHTDGVAVSANGWIHASPRLEPLDDDRMPSEPVQVWSMIADPAGRLYLGTGPEGNLVRVSEAGKQTLLFTAPEPLITALAFDSRGRLLAATAPGGTIYRVNGDGTGVPWCETGERYVWALARGVDGRLFAATGERGVVLQIDTAGNAEPFFEIEDPHVVSLLPRPGGGLLAGSAGRGRVFEIDGDGNALVLHAGALDEVSALASEPDGSVIAALLSAPDPIARRPEVRLRLPDGTPVGRTPDEGVAALDESQGPVVKGFIEGLESPVPGTPERVVGRLLRIRQDGSVETLWSSARETPFALLGEPGGAVLFGTGEPARLFRLETGGDVTLLSTLDEGQITGLARVGRTSFLATSNAAAVYRMESRQVETGVFLSEPIDAGGTARWGSIRWAANGEAVEIYTRTGNSRSPDSTWSAWSPTLTDSRGSRIVNPDGRFLQWRVRFPAPGPARVSGVNVSYEPYNRSPELRELRITPDSYAAGTGFEITWSARDSDRDPLDMQLRYRLAGSTEWSTAEAAPSGSNAAETPPEGGPKELQRGTLTWNVSTLPEGSYELRGALTDRAAHPPGEGESVPLEMLPAVTVDRTPPSLEFRPSEGGLEIVVRDEHSVVSCVELHRSGERQHTLRPVDGVCDSLEETFRLEKPRGTEWTVRAVDAAGNPAERPLD